MGFDIDQLCAELGGGDDVFFAYAGSVESVHINSILEEIENRFVAQSAHIRVRKKVYNIMVECLQNLFHHSDNVPKDLTGVLGERFGMVVIKSTTTDYRIIVGNFTSADNVRFLTEKIEKLNSLSGDELKDMYKFILNYQKLSSKGGGGLGLIDIARKSDKKLEYRFYPYDQHYYFYRLDIFVSI